MHSGKPHQNETEQMTALSPQLAHGDFIAEGIDQQCPTLSASKHNSSSLATNNLPRHELGKALLPNKLRLAKILACDPGARLPPSGRSTPRESDSDDGRGEIRVLSPSLVNSQVLSKTRPLSPDLFVQSFRRGIRQDENRETLPRPGNGRRKKDLVDGQKSVEGSESEDSNVSAKASNKRRRIFKLKFHHQALPQEYLDHYEASLGNVGGWKMPHPKKKTDKFINPKDIEPPREVIPNKLQSGLRQGPRNKERGSRTGRPVTVHETGMRESDKIIKEFMASPPEINQNDLKQAAIARAQSVPSVMMAVGKKNKTSPRQTPTLSDRMMSNDEYLSYASDMSIDDSPKRGKKKNGVNKRMGRGLGSMGLGTDGQMETPIADQAYGVLAEPEHPSFPVQYQTLEKHSLARSRSYTSLMSPSIDQSEPLNLCVRDSTYSQDIPNISNEMSADDLSIKMEPMSPMTEDSTRSSSTRNVDVPQSPVYPPHEYHPWTYNASSLGNNPVWLHDYRLKTEDGLSSGQSTPSLCSQTSHLTCLSPPVWPHFSPPPYSPSPAPPLSPMTPPHHSRHIQNLLKDSLHGRLNESPREKLMPREALPNPDKTGRLNSSFRLSSKTGARRKRSPLFIPPADPNTEVSICKFKFTGGANPVLEEKKMVSVDAGGTLRYFSGGDRMIPRDLRNIRDNGPLTGKLLQNLSKCEKDVKKIRLESDTDDTCSLPGGGLDICTSTPTSPSCTLERGMGSSMCMTGPIEDSPKRKRRSKKSSVREKLEQTLREKGLLIQTQQVESAEGATYCKFRQLRKITRYLFRSWKDHLPGQMQDGMPVDGTIPDEQSPSAYCPESFKESHLENEQFSSHHR